MAKAAYLTAGEINDKVITQYHLPNDIHNNTKVKPAACSSVHSEDCNWEEGDGRAVVLILKFDWPNCKNSDVDEHL